MQLNGALVSDPPGRKVTVRKRAFMVRFASRFAKQRKELLGHFYVSRKKNQGILSVEKIFQETKTQLRRKEGENE